MKRMAILLIGALVAITLYAQTQAITDSSPHLAFKGVPVDGTLFMYVAKMKQQGFTHMTTEDGVALLRGDFAGYKNCMVAAITLKPRDLVYKIGVMFPEQDTWGFLSTNYFSLKEMLTEKYGKPAESVEKFDTRSEPRDDNSRMYEVMMDRCKYYTIYKTKKGSIELSILHNDVTSCFVRLLYTDKINGDSMREKAMDDL